MGQANSSFLKRLYNKYAILFFVGMVASLIVLFYVFYRNPWVENQLITPLVNLYAHLAGSLLSWLGFSNKVSADIIFSPSFSVSVKKGCDAAEPMAVFTAGVMAFPAMIRHKLFGLGFGLAILFLLNIIRIATLYVVGIYYPTVFEVMHLALWQVVFILVAILLWFVWLNYFVSKPIKHD